MNNKLLQSLVLKRQLLKLITTSKLESSWWRWGRRRSNRPWNRSWIRILTRAPRIASRRIVSMPAWRPTICTPPRTPPWTRRNTRRITPPRAPPIDRRNATRITPPWAPPILRRNATRITRPWAPHIERRNARIITSPWAPGRNTGWIAPPHTSPWPRWDTVRIVPPPPPPPWWNAPGRWPIAPASPIGIVIWWILAVPGPVRRGWPIAPANGWPTVRRARSWIGPSLSAVTIVRRGWSGSLSFRRVTRRSAPRVGRVTRRSTTHYKRKNSQMLACHVRWLIIFKQFLLKQHFLVNSLPGVCHSWMVGSTQPMWEF